MTTQSTSRTSPDWDFYDDQTRDEPSTGRKKQTFEHYTRERRRLLLACDELEAVWLQILSGRTAFEGLSSPNEAPSTDSTVMVALADARKRLASTTIEIGVFGNVKRGKSTLLNALVGEVVSAMAVTPVTAVPVWVENGPRRSQVLFDDGSIKEIDDTLAAAEMASQRFRRSKSGPKVIRVMQQLPLDWLPDGLRLVDTPGLDDPSNVEAYEELTLAELARVSAAVFVFVSPPGASDEEMRLLRRLGANGVDKVFLVCNFYSDQWRSADTRRKVSECIKSTVTGATDGNVAPEDIRIYQVSAKDASASAAGGRRLGVSRVGYGTASSGS